MMYTKWGTYVTSRTEKREFVDVTRCPICGLTKKEEKTIALTEIEGEVRIEIMTCPTCKSNDKIKASASHNVSYRYVQPPRPTS